MSGPVMQVYRDAEGNPDPRRDFRDVPLATMAEYLGVEPQTVYRRYLAGAYPKGTRRIGTRVYYRPAVLMETVHQAVSP